MTVRAEIFFASFVSIFPNNLSPLKHVLHIAPIWADVLFLSTLPLLLVQVNFTHKLVHHKNHEQGCMTFALSLRQLLDLAGVNSWELGYCPILRRAQTLYNYLKLL